jgi:group I intron endonuclease
MHSIYLLWCGITNKTYVGQSRHLTTRLRYHLNLADRAKGSYMHRAIRKYGGRNFYWCLLHGDIPTQAEADSLECMEIQRLGSLAPAGYNILPGRQGTRPRVSAEVRQLMSERSGANWASPAYRNRVTASHLGKTQSETTKTKRAAAHYQPIRCKELVKDFDSVKSAEVWLSEELGKTSPGTSIAGCARGLRETAGGYHWEYIE